MTKCDYCTKTPYQITGRESQDNRAVVCDHLFGEDSTDFIVSIGEEAEGFAIRYCPMCGRKLVEDDE